MTRWIDGGERRIDFAGSMSPVSMYNALSLARGIKKAALSALVAHWAASLTPVRVNAVCPGNMLTDGSVWRRLAQESPGELDAFLKAEVPLGRVAESSEIAQAILFLLSHHASFVTGATLVVDGGQSRSFA